MHWIHLWVKAFLAIHIAAGASSFLLAPVALATAKGGKQHKRWGMVYLWSMGVVAATALPMAFFLPVRFLALVAVFSFYFAFSGLSRAAAEGAGARRERGADRLDRRRCYSLRRVRCWRGWRCSSGCGAGNGDRCGSCSGSSGCALAAAQMCQFVAEAKGEDVLVVHAPGELHRELHCGVVGVQRGDVVAGDWKSVVCVAMAVDGRGACDCADDGLLQAEVRATA